MSLVERFLRLSKVQERLCGFKPTAQQLDELSGLLSSRSYAKFKGSEELIVDFILNFEPGFISRFDRAKANSYHSLEYFQARYACNAEQRWKSYKQRLSALAKKNFQNCTDHWNGIEASVANAKISEIQRSRAKLTTLALESKPEYWYQQGLSSAEAIKMARLSQSRNLDFFIGKYGTEVGTARFHLCKERRLKTWNSRSDEFKADANKRKGRTFDQLVDKFGIEYATELVRKRVCTSAVSVESKIFFRELDRMLGPKLSVLSVTGYKCPELCVRASSNIYYIDYTLGNCIVEYHGSYWHADPRRFNFDSRHPNKDRSVMDIWKYDQQKLDSLVRLGYTVKVVWSDDVNSNPRKLLTETQEFILENYYNGVPASC